MAREVSKEAAPFSIRYRKIVRSVAFPRKPADEEKGAANGGRVRRNKDIKRFTPPLDRSTESETTIGFSLVPTTRKCPLADIRVYEIESPMCPIKSIKTIRHRAFKLLEFFLLIISNQILVVFNFRRLMS